MAPASEVRVVCRVRAGPGAPKGPVGDASDATSITLDGNKYAFSRVIGADEPQSEAVKAVAVGVAQSLADGFNNTVIAYGQTGTGKTFTMRGTPDEPGVVPTVVQELLGLEGVKVSVANAELYRGAFRDLLTPEKNPMLREDVTSGVHFANLSWFGVAHWKAARRLIRRGDKNRAVGATDFNAHSSRSHAAVILRVTSTGGRHALALFVDLAGSESPTGAGGTTERRKEALENNKALEVLGRVVRQLADKEAVVSFRDSLLTRMLKMGLGGNSCTTLVATVSGGGKAARETKRTLAFATDAKRVRQHAKQNVRAENRELRDQLENLRRALREAQAQPPPPEASDPELPVNICATCQRVIRDAEDDEGDDSESDDGARDDAELQERVQMLEEQVQLYQLIQQQHETRLLHAETARAEACEDAQQARAALEKVRPLLVKVARQGRA
jgi:hypothetical protein